MQAIYLFGHKILCDGHVTDKGVEIAKSLNCIDFLCDGYVTNTLKVYLKVIR